MHRSECPVFRLSRLLDRARMTQLTGAEVTAMAYRGRLAIAFVGSPVKLGDDRHKGSRVRGRGKSTISFHVSP